MMKINPNTEMAMITNQDFTIYQLLDELIDLLKQGIPGETPILISFGPNPRRMRNIKMERLILDRTKFGDLEPVYECAQHEVLFS